MAKIGENPGWSAGMTLFGDHGTAIGQLKIGSDRRVELFPTIVEDPSQSQLRIDFSQRRDFSQLKIGKDKRV